MWVNHVHQDITKYHTDEIVWGGGTLQASPWCDMCVEHPPINTRLNDRWEKLFDLMVIINNGAGADLGDLMGVAAFAGGRNAEEKMKFDPVQHFSRVLNIHMREYHRPNHAKITAGSP